MQHSMYSSFYNDIVFHGFALIGSVSVIYCKILLRPNLCLAMTERKMFLQVLDELPFSSLSQSEIIDMYMEYG